MTTLLAFVVTLGVLIIVHEWGHYRAARACGVKVLRFSIGFGRVVARWQRRPDATEFVVGLLPLGGYVRMLDERDGPVAPHDRAQAFGAKSLWQRSAIVAAGPVANFALAVLLYAAAHWIGVDEPRAVLATPAPGTLAERAGLRAGDWVQATSVDGDTWRDVASMPDLRWVLTQAALRGLSVQLQLSDLDGRGRRVARLDLDRIERDDLETALARRVGIGVPYSAPVLGEIQAGGPAAAAGLRSGDRVLAVDGTAVADAQALRERIRGAVQGDAPRSTQWRLERAGTILEVEVRPRVVDERGHAVGRIDAVVGQMPQKVTVRLGFLEGAWRGVERTWEVSALTVRMIGRMLVGEASLRNLSGPLTIADYAGQSAEQGLTYYLGFLAMLSVSLGVLNLLPLPMLDGGHLMYHLFEGVSGRPVSEAWQRWLQRGGALIVLLMMTLALSNDLARLLGLY